MLCITLTMNSAALYISARPSDVPHSSAQSNTEPTVSACRRKPSFEVKPDAYEGLLK